MEGKGKWSVGEVVKGMFDSGEVKGVWMWDIR